MNRPALKRARSSARQRPRLRELERRNRGPKRRPRPNCDGRHVRAMPLHVTRRRRVVARVVFEPLHAATQIGVRPIDARIEHRDDR